MLSTNAVVLSQKLAWVGIIVISHTSHAIFYVGLCSSLCYIVSAYLENLLETGF